MGFSLNQFDYNLPESFIAQHSVEPRDSSRMLVLDKSDGHVKHYDFLDIVDLLHKGDVLVFNNTKVFKARLKCRNEKREFELFLLRAVDSDFGSDWHALIYFSKRLNVGDVVDVFGSGDDVLKAKLVEKLSDGVMVLRFDISFEKVISFADRNGEIPLPPYVNEKINDADKYQTMYAKEVGSVAAPTAGFHFTERVLNKLREKGVDIEYLTLHVGIGTFRPIFVDDLDDHVMHTEFVDISDDVAKRIEKAKSEGRRVVAVGTTTVRTLEGVNSL